MNPTATTEDDLNAQPLPVYPSTLHSPRNAPAPPPDALIKPYGNASPITELPVLPPLSMDPTPLRCSADMKPAPKRAAERSHTAKPTPLVLKRSVEFARDTKPAPLSTRKSIDFSIRSLSPVSPCSLSSVDGIQQHGSGPRQAFAGKVFKPNMRVIEAEPDTAMFHRKSTEAYLGMNDIELSEKPVRREKQRGARRIVWALVVVLIIAIVVILATVLVEEFKPRHKAFVEDGGGDVKVGTDQHGVRLGKRDGEDWAVRLGVPVFGL